jgi:sporulation protein YlmC with PRC-barrel domain
MTDDGAVQAEILRARDFLEWTVTDPSGSKVGKVTDLLLDRGGQVRYLAVKAGRNVLVPVSELEWGRGTLVLPRWTADDLKHLPEYDPGAPITGRVLEELEWAHPRFYGSGNPPPRGAPGGPAVVPMREAKDFKLAGDAPDLRKWNVFAADDERVGTVSELLVDPAAMKIRYLDVDLADDLYTLKEDRHVLVPLEHVELRERGSDVWIRRLTSREIARLPAYTGGAPDPYVLELVDRAFGG